MSRLLEPFLTAFPRWRARPWLLAALLLLAPGAYFAGRYFQSQSGATSMHQMEGYEEILRRAHVTAKALGIPADQWSATFRFNASFEMNRFAQRERARLPEAVRRILPVAQVRVLMIESASAARWVEFTYSGEGQLLGYETSPGLFTADEMLANTGTREVAQGALEAVLDPSAFEFGEPASKSKDGGRGQRFDWSLRAKCCPELAIAATVDVVGPRPAFLAVKTSFQNHYLYVRNTPLNLLVDVLRMGFLLGAMGFVGFRFAKRAMERAVPYGRALVVWAVLIVTGLIYVSLQPFGEVSGEPIFLAGPFRFAGVLLTLLVYVVIGLLLALAYGATEGDLRERYAGKLTSLDALLSGRLWSRNVGVSVLAGAAWGAWAYGLTQWVRAGLAPGFIPLPGFELRFSYSVAPWLGLVAANLTEAVRIAVTVLLVSLSAGIWLSRGKRWRWVVTALCSFSAVLTSGSGSPFVDANAGIMAVSTLATLWLGLSGLDFLAATVATIVALAGTSLGDVTAILPAWSQPAAVARGIGIATLGLGLVAVYLARRYEDAEVMPGYARNIEERQSRQEEVSATREAQLRLLPLEPPRVPGLGIAAFCAPSQQGVSGDFFDFYPMSRGRLGLLVADGRAGGLGAALTIAMAKGFVQYAAQRDWPAGETLRRLRQAWHSDDDEAGELSLAYAIFDPAQHQIRFARLGTTPVMLAGIDAQDRAESLSGLEADGLAEGVTTLAVGDVVLVYTDGVPQRFAENHRDGLDAWLRNRLRLTTGVTADRIAESLRESLRAHEGNAPDDLTAVVIRFEPAETASLEVSA